MSHAVDHADFLRKLIADCGADVVIPGPQSDVQYHKDWTSPNAIMPLAVALPRTTTQVSRILQHCHVAGMAVVPQGGLTGLVGAARPQADGIVLNCSRLRGTIDIDAQNRSATVYAGHTLQELQEAAKRADLLFPVDFGARGSCQIGGAIATNAGGVHVMHYGMMRSQVLGLEVVMADGTVIDSLRSLLKNNTGYDLKHWFIGSEGTLGIVTRAVVRLLDRPLGRQVALVQTQDLAQAYRILSLARQNLPGLTAFEALWPSYYAYAVHATRLRPLPDSGYLTLLIELHSANPEQDQNALLALLEQCLHAGLINEAAVAQSESQCIDFWNLREANNELMHHYKRLVGFDVSLSAASMQAFLTTCEQRLRQLSSAILLHCFGHLGDGNVHLVAIYDAAPDVHENDIKSRVLTTVREMQGSISAEHGIGLDKLPYLSYSRSDAELALMRTIKLALDPHNILNPGKLLHPL